MRFVSVKDYLLSCLIMTSNRIKFVHFAGIPIGEGTRVCHHPPSSNWSSMHLGHAYLELPGHYYL